MWASMKTKLQLEGFGCGYGAIRAVTDLSVEVREGEVFALLGPNGAGKTSTIQAIMGFIPLQAGRLLLDGQDISRAKATERAGLGMALVPEGRRLFSDMSVLENLAVGAYTKTKNAEARSMERVFALFPRLAERRAQISGSLSGGEQQMLAFGRALMSEPRLLLVDELSLGLMPKAAGLFIEVLKKLREEGVTSVLVEQNTKRALRIADTVCVLASGRSVFTGTAEAARQDAELFRRYLGAGAE
jgi:branched-chain amino acid transport system ATP-binding protein